MSPRPPVLTSPDSFRAELNETFPTRLNVIIIVIIVIIIFSQRNVLKCWGSREEFAVSVAVGVGCISVMVHMLLSSIFLVPGEAEFHDVRP